jgi:hypothetical protein
MDVGDDRQSNLAHLSGLAVGAIIGRFDFPSP